MSSYEAGVGVPDSTEEEEYWLRLLSDLGSEPSVPLSMRPSPSTPIDGGYFRNDEPARSEPKDERQSSVEMTSSIHRTNTNQKVLSQPTSPAIRSDTGTVSSPLKKQQLEDIGLDTKLNINSRQEYNVQRDGIAGISRSNGGYDSDLVKTPTYPPPPPPFSRNVYTNHPESTVEMITTIDLDEEKPRELPDMWGESDEYISDQIDFIFCSDNMNDYEDMYSTGAERMDALTLCKSSLVQLQPVLRNAVGYATDTMATAGRALYASTAAKLGSNLATSKAITNKLNTANRAEAMQDRSPYQGPSLGSLHQTILFLSRHLDSAALGKVVMTASGTVVTLRDIAVMHIARYVRSNVYLSSFVGCVHESTLFMVDRLRAGVELYSHILQGDDPEKMHLELLKDKPDWQHLLLRCSMASLTWKQRQLLEETRDGGSINSADFKRLVQAQILEFDRQRVAKIATEYFYIAPGVDLSSAQPAKQPLALPAPRTAAPEDGAEVNAQALKSILTDTASVDQLASDRDLVDDSQALDVLKSNIHSWLVEEATLGDEDAQYALARFFTPPGFQESPSCVLCERPFSITLFRHHCRFCGRSVCDDHSAARRCIYRYGLVTPVRVCAQCADSIDETHRMDGIIWRDLRVSAYLRNKLIPYFNPAVDRGIDKVFRIADYSMTVARNALTYNFPAKLALDTVEVLKRYGLTGFTGLLLRKDFMESVEMLKRISGMESMFSLSLHELTACVYYKLAIERGLRGSNPDSELLAHAPRARRTSTSNTSNIKISGYAQQAQEAGRSTGAVPQQQPQASQVPQPPQAQTGQPQSCDDNSNDGADYECKNASDADVQLSIRFAPLALNIIYEENPVDCQRLAKLQGWDTIFTNVETDLAPEQPCYTLFGASFPEQGEDCPASESTKSNSASEPFYSAAAANSVAGRAAAKCEASRTSTSDASEAPLRKPPVLEAVLVIRGTQTIQDVVTDIRAAPLVFPPPAEEVDAALRGSSAFASARGLTMHEGQSQSQSQTSPEKADGSAAEKEARWDWLAVPSHHTYSCGGMVRAAMYVLREVGPALRRLHAEGYKLTIVGHSLGGAVAALLTYMLQNAVPSVQCVTYGCPSCVDAATSDMLRGRVLSVVLHDDCISRITPQSIRLLMKELMVFREQMFEHLQQEWVDVLKRASGLWTPRWRIAAAPPSAERLVSAARNSGAVASMVSGQQQASKTASAQASVAPLAGLESWDEPAPSANSGANRGASTEGKAAADAASGVLVEEEELAQLWLPGRVMHIYVHNGQCRAAEVSRDFPDLRVIVLQGNIFEDHRSERMLNALLEVRAVRQAPRAAPAWQSYDAADTCACCHNSFTWNSTFTGQAQEFRDKYNCRYCGHLVCDACSTHRRAMPKLGHMFPRRICDQCLYKGDFATI